jgi:hypothetical protein
MTNAGKYKGEGGGLVSHVFNYNEPLWVTSEDGKTFLSEVKDRGGKFKNWWSKEEKEADLYFWGVNEKANSYKARTTIVIPLRNLGGPMPIGVINFECEEYIIPTEKAKSIFENLAISVSTFMQLSKTRQLQKNNTEEISKAIQSSPSIKLSKLLEKPKVFIAFPNQCEKDVIECIERCCEEYKNDFNFVSWKNMDEPGAVSDQIVNTIKESKFGIIYFSERIIIDGITKYKDNPNVLFEAGIFQAISDYKDNDNQNDDSITKGWIPIREDKELSLSHTPFDIQHLRFIYLTRQNGRLEEGTFLSKLRRMIESMKKR